MKSVLCVSILVLACVSWGAAKDLLVGTSFNARLVWQHKAEYMAIPFKKRVKEVFYSDPSQQTLKGIIARDQARSEGSATVTAGGVGSTFVNIRLKSERGSALDYLIELYV